MPTISFKIQSSSKFLQVDFGAVASILEAGFIRLRKYLPNVKEVVLITDNDGCHQS